MKNIQAPFDIDLISSKRDYLALLLLSIFLFSLSISWEYYKYRDLLNSANKIDESLVSLDAQVLLQYKKPEKNYYVLKLRDKNGAIFYTTSRDNLKDLRTRYINLYGKLGEDCSFQQYLKSCFVISFSISLLPDKNYRHTLARFIDSQHDDKFKANDEFGINLMSSFYKAIFLAIPMDIQIRETSAKLGIAHLLAISGFHLGILCGALYFLILIPYRFFQRRYFTHRNEFYDINFLLICAAFFYLTTLHFTPSFLRSFVMFCFAIFVLWRGLKLISFKLLFACALLILALFPRIFFSVGFWLSVSGVFYIYLFAKYAPKCNKAIYALALNFAVYFNMLPIVHYIFEPFSAYQLFAPFLTLAFVAFYPFSLFLHFIGLGGILDSVLFSAINYDFFAVDLSTPFWLFIIFVIISLLSMFSKIAYYLMNLISILFCLYGIFLVGKEFI